MTLMISSSFISVLLDNSYGVDCSLANGSELFLLAVSMQINCLLNKLKMSLILEHTIGPFFS